MAENDAVEPNSADFGPDPLSRADLLGLAEAAALRGSVTAIKLLLDEMRREAEKGPSGGEFDDLDNVAPFRRAS